MNYHPAPWVGPDTMERMAKWEMKKRFGLPEELWWKLASGPEIAVKWPSGWVVLHEDSDGSKVSAESADPNDHYRPWLEKNVGRQGWDWNWRHQIVDTMITVGYEEQMMAKDRVVIKFRKKHKEAALMAKLLWS